MICVTRAREIPSLAAILARLSEGLFSISRHRRLNKRSRSPARKRDADGEAQVPAASGFSLPSEAILSRWDRSGADPSPDLRRVEWACPLRAHSGREARTRLPSGVRRTTTPLESHWIGAIITWWAPGEAIASPFVTAPRTSMPAGSGFAVS